MMYVKKKCIPNLKNFNDKIEMQVNFSLSDDITEREMLSHKLNKLDEIRWTFPFFKVGNLDPGNVYRTPSHTLDWHMTPFESDKVYEREKQKVVLHFL